MYEGFDGNDNELLVNNEIVPMVPSGWVRYNDGTQPTPFTEPPEDVPPGTPPPPPNVPTVTITGKVETYSAWGGAEILVTNTVPATRLPNGVFSRGGLGYLEGLQVALSSTSAGDAVVWAQPIPEEANGVFTIPYVKPGDYTLAVWDAPQRFILDVMAFTVPSRVTTFDIGTFYLTGWFTNLEGYVYEDTNANGIMDAGEVGAYSSPKFFLVYSYPFCRNFRRTFYYLQIP